VMNDNITDIVDPAMAIPAATLVVFRARAGGAAELLVVERSAKMAFAGGAIVFPGGRIDAHDHEIAADSALVRGRAEGEEAAARVAAIRETLEESGIAIGFVGAPTQDWTATAQKRLHNKAAFADLLREAGHTLDLDVLVPWSRWRPNHREARVFDTRFYIATADGAPDPVVDETENVSSFWASAADIIAAADAGKVKVIYPTRRNLERLALFSAYDDAHAHARSIAIEIVSPTVEQREDGMHLCIPGHLGYPVTSELLSDVQRGFGASAGKM
jgi:8-oxo-dGTP pyrophosphatase MutT (NUDIX family)